MILHSASRNILQATYTPIKVKDKKDDSSDSTEPKKPRKYRAWQKYQFVTNLNIVPEEIKWLLELYKKELKKLPTEDQKKLKEVISTLNKIKIIFDNNRPDPLKYLSEFAEMSEDILSIIAHDLLEIRQKSSEDILQKIEDLQTEITKKSTEPQDNIPPRKQDIKEKSLPKRFKEIDTEPILTFKGLKVLASEESTKLKKMKVKDEDLNKEFTLKGQRIKKEAVLIRTKEEPSTPKIQLKKVVPDLTVDGLLEIAKSQLIESDSFETLTSYFTKDNVQSQIKLKSLKSVYIDSLAYYKAVVLGFQSELEIEPVGFLHLEKLSFTPAGIERGELIYSIPLAPGEEVNIAHKEWSNTSEEFEKIVSDSFEEFSEEGVVESNELSQSTNSERQHSSGFNTGVTASGKYGPVRITASAGYNVNNASSQSEQIARNHSSQTTSKASSRSKREHKISFKVASASGVEDATIRKIVNPDPQNTKRIDYYQLIRKWQVDLFRYGIRLTYDMIIPEPGSDILSKIIEIQEIDEQLQGGFVFNLDPDYITRYNYDNYASTYGANVTAPPDEWIWLNEVETRHWNSKGDSKKPPHFFSFEMKVDDDYQVYSYGASWDSWSWDDDHTRNIGTNFNSWLNKSGTFHVTYELKYISSFIIDVSLTCRLKDSVYKKWKMSAWETIRNAAEAAYLERRQMLKQRRDQLSSELGFQDALSLRKAEREEVMKGVLRWLFGPSFEFNPVGMPANLYDLDGSIGNSLIWNRVRAFGEIGKFLHHAIEWENMLYFLYPYFWSHSSRWNLKKYLDHPDPLHRSFLKAGSARVVFTIRPGFEQAFLSLVETGTIDGLTANHPYFKISDEIKFHAQTNYPGIPPANPVENYRALLLPQQKKAWEEIKNLIALLQAFYEDNDRYPTEVEGLDSLDPYTNADIPVVPKLDPWGKEYLYRNPGIYGEYDLASFGADGIEGGEGENADITSWATASLIGRWYEYTPTSATDLIMDYELPIA